MCGFLYLPPPKGQTYHHADVLVQLGVLVWDVFAQVLLDDEGLLVYGPNDLQTTRYVKEYICYDAAKYTSAECSVA